MLGLVGIQGLSVYRLIPPLYTTPIEPVLDVQPDAFDPPPRVDSAVVRMTPLPAAGVADIDTRRLGELVSIAFSQRRKILRHTLGAWIKAQHLDLDFDLQRRAEEVSVSEYLALARAKPQPD